MSSEFWYYTKEMNRLRMNAGASQEATRTESARVERQIRSMIDAIKDGLYHQSMKAEMELLETRRADLQGALDKAADRPPLLHPSLADTYRQRITALTAGLTIVDGTGEIAETLRSLVTAIVLTPGGWGTHDNAARRPCRDACYGAGARGLFCGQPAIDLPEWAGMRRN